MKRNTVLIALFIAAIIGLSVVQYQYFRIGLNLAGLQFNDQMSKAIVEIQEDLEERNELTYLMGTVLTENKQNFKISLDSVRSASAFFLNDFLTEKLVEEGISAEFSYELYSKDSVFYLHSERRFDAQTRLLRFPIVLKGYLPQLVDERLILELRFQNLNRYFLTQLNGLTIPSLIFLAVLIVVIVWVYRAFYLQRNLITSTNEFINNLTHELKTPLFSLRVATKIMEEKKEVNGELLGVMKTQLDKLGEQIDRVLQLAILEGKKDILKRDVFDFKLVLDRVCKDFSLMMDMEGGSFVSALEDGPFWLKGDSDHLENALWNLLENAKKYSKEKVEIRLQAKTNSQWLELSVEDKGMGMQPEEVKHIFDKYYRIGQGDRHDVKGYGLGLHYVHKILKLHKGRVEVESSIREGSIFRLIIPLHRSPK